MWSGESTPALTSVAPYPDALPSFSGSELRLKALLKEAGFTVKLVSATSARFYGRSSSFFIPGAFLYKLRAGISPHVCQLAALSRITGISFWRCMQACGHDAQIISSLQLRLERDQTVLLPLPLQRQINTRGRFAKIGKDDAQVIPELAPDSIVRVKVTGDTCMPAETSEQSRLWLIEHEHGLACCRLEAVGRDHARVVPPRAPFWGWPLKINREIRILGEVDLRGLRSSLDKLPDPGEPDDGGSDGAHNCQLTFSKLLQAARARAGLPFRAAHELSIQVAQLLGPDYAVGLGALCDYEASDRVPRHIAKLLALCTVYCMDFMTVIKTAGIHILESGEAEISPPSLNRTIYYYLEAPRSVFRVLRTGRGTSMLGREQRNQINPLEHP